MKQEGIPFFLWYTQYQGALKLYQTKIVKWVDALKANVNPEGAKRKKTNKIISLFGEGGGVSASRVGAQ